MAGPLFYDRVMETSTTTSTGTYTLAGAVTGFQSFAAVGNANACYYCAQDVDTSGTPTGGWEVGTGTYTVSGTTLARTAILASSNSNSAVNWSAGTRRIFLVLPAAGRLPPANLNQAAGLSVFGVTGSSTADLAAITASADKQILMRTSSSAVAWYLPKAVLVSKSGTQNITNNTTTVITFDQESYDNDTMHDNVTNNSRITFTTGGKYTISFYALYGANATGYRYTDVLLNNTTAISIDSRTGVNSDVSGALCSFDYVFVATDYIELRAFQNSGGTRTLDARFSAKEILGV